MTEWLFAQQYVVSLAALLLIANEKWLTAKIGALRCYQLWLLFPALLIMNNLPAELIPQSGGQIARYVAGLTPSTTMQVSFPLFWLWASVALLLFSAVSIQYWRLYRSLGNPCNSHYGSEIRSSDAVTSPLLFGIVSPVIVVPLDFATRFSSSQQQLIIRHELVHLHRKDGVWNAVALVALCLFWFNPLVWLAVRAFRMSQELACDETVLKNSTKAVKVDYAKTLLQCAGAPPYSTVLYPTIGDKKTMMKRLEMITRPAKRNKRLSTAIVLTAMALLGNTALANKPAPQKYEDSKINLATPVKRVNPVYPQQAVTENIEGEVVLRFDISATGATNNISVVSAKPEGMFDESAVTALAQWQYKPRIQGGKALPQKDILVQLDFRLEPEPEKIRVMPE